MFNLCPDSKRLGRPVITSPHFRILKFCKLHYVHLNRACPGYPHEHVLLARLGYEANLPQRRGNPDIL
jgi:hypothetical protein